ncbi:MAG: hypothetical protein K2F85_01835, partial [Helicobacter sp.]|nr:hypothetical protein [Helicobacter sp.]
SGTQGKEFTNPDGSLNAGDTQKIVVNTNSATLNINGAGGVDKFDIEASSFTKTLTIAGNLGTVPNYEEARNNYDTVRIDLSKTSGVNLDISKLLVSNPNNEGIVITSSKGADNITLTAGANHDIIEFKAGGGLSAQQEEYTVELGSLRLAAGQSFTIDGLTITNVTGFTNGASGVQSAATILTADDIAIALKTYLATGALGNASASASHISTSSAVSTWVRIEGDIESLTTANGWLNKTGNADVKVGTNGTSLIFTNANKANVTDLDFSFSGNGKTNGFGAETNKIQTFVVGAAASGAQTSGTIAASAFSSAALKFTNSGSASATVSADFTFVINGESLAFTITSAELASSGSATLSLANLASLLGGAATADGFSMTMPSGFTMPSWTFSSSSGLKVTGLASGDSFAYGSAEVAYKDATPATQGQLTIDFGSEGLLAGQSYSFLGKTVIATKDLTGEQIAEAFAFGDETSSGVDGAVVLGSWASGGYTASGSYTGSATSAGIFESNVLFDISGSSLILMEQKPGIVAGLKSLDVLESKGQLTITGTGTLAVRTDSVTGTTTVQGEKDSTIAADSYVTFAGIGTGSAASGADAGTVTAIKATTNALDTITNFDVSNDKLLLKDVNGNVLSFTNGGTITAPTDIYVDTLGSTLNATADGGMISFSITAGSGAATGADAITLDQKLYAAVNGVDDNDAVGFEHGGDTYVVLGGGGDKSASTADLVIKLAGVTGVTDITSILA